MNLGSGQNTHGLSIDLKNYIIIKYKNHKDCLCLNIELVLLKLTAGLDVCMNVGN